MRKIYLKVSLRVIVSADDNVDVSDIEDSLDVTAYADMDGACVIEHEVQSICVDDSK